MGLEPQLESSHGKTPKHYIDTKTLVLPVFQDPASSAPLIFRYCFVYTESDSTWESSSAFSHQFYHRGRAKCSTKRTQCKFYLFIPLMSVSRQK
ncbi:hypothetical protein VTN49DRAFT_2560 [Thermomyces lanuginosus]|uniref:uncharacterized protein n=1 Tax=Thermomyces lanuginosus TaxID=5541 RepID=UPI00374372BF